MTRTCGSCDNPVTGGLVICSRCERQTRHNLADMEAHRQELVIAMTRMVRMSAPNDAGRGTVLALLWARMGDRFLFTITDDEIRQIAATLPPARPAADALHSQRSLLVSWCRLLMEDTRPVLGPVCRYRCTHGSCLAVIATRGPVDSIAGMACYLVQHLSTFHIHAAAGELVDEFRDLVREMVRAVDMPPHRRFQVGPCPVPECPGMAEALVTRDDEPLTVCCRACGGVWFSEQWMRLGEMVERKRKVAA